MLPYGAGRIVYAVPAGYLANVGGDVRPVYQMICGEAGRNRIAVPQNATATVSGDKRPIYGTAGCLDGQLFAGQRVVAIPQGYKVNIGGDTRPVYAFVCCPPGSSSSSSSSSSSGGVIVPCCPSTVLPTTLYATLPNVTCACGFSGGSTTLPAGTYPLTRGWPNAPDVWSWCSADTINCPVSPSPPAPPYDKYTGWEIDFWCSSSGLGAQGFFLQVYYKGLAPPSFNNCGDPVLGLANVNTGAWTTAVCNPPHWQGTLVKNSSNCGSGNAGTVTITP